MTVLEAEKVVSDRLGEQYQVAKINGFWVIGHKSLAGEGGFGRISPDPLRKSLDKAIDDIVSGR